MLQTEHVSSYVGRRATCLHMQEVMSVTGGTAHAATTEESSAMEEVERSRIYISHLALV